LQLVMLAFNLMSGLPKLGASCRDDPNKCSSWPWRCSQGSGSRNYGIGLQPSSCRSTSRLISPAL